jgi:hypothetical protein
LRGAYLSAAIQGLGENAGDGGFADAAMAGKDVAVRDAVLGEGVEQGARDVILAGDVGKFLWPILTSQNLITHAIKDSQ